MEKEKNNPVLLIAEDDKDDRILIQEAFAENGFTIPLYFVKDGEELIDYLKRTGPFATNTPESFPDLIMLDLNLPKKDGREVLRELKSDPVLKLIPIIIFSTSNSHLDISNSYELGANCYITKPQTFKELMEAIRKIGAFWLNLSEFPSKPEL
jgi:two-component system, response regulator